MGCLNLLQVFGFCGDEVVVEEVVQVAEGGSLFRLAVPTLADDVIERRRTFETVRIGSRHPVARLQTL